MKIDPSPSPYLSVTDWFLWSSRELMLWFWISTYISSYCNFNSIFPLIAISISVRYLVLVFGRTRWLRKGPDTAEGGLRLSDDKRCYLIFILQGCSSVPHPISLSVLNFDVFTCADGCGKEERKQRKLFNAYGTQLVL